MAREKMVKALPTVLDKGLTVLEMVERAGRAVTIQEVAAATGIQRLAVYRLLVTLEKRKYVRRLADKRYEPAMRRRVMQVGYLAPAESNHFRADVRRSLEGAAVREGVGLTVWECGDEDRAGVLAKANALAAARVDVAMFFQPVELLGYMVADRFASAGIPFITIERPIQGGVYFGANNYQAGKLAGQTLGRYAREHWAGEYDQVVLVEGPETTTHVQARLAGALVGLREVAGEVEERRVVHVKGGLQRDSGKTGMAEMLKTLKRRRRLLVSCFNDLSALGAMEAVKEARRSGDVAIVGQNASWEGRGAIRNGGCFIASVAFFPERYGGKLIRLAEEMAMGKRVDPVVYTEHEVLHAGNVGLWYPGEAW